MRLIDADDLKKTLRDWIRGYWTDDNVGSEFADMIDHAETDYSAPPAHSGRSSAQPDRSSAHLIQSAVQSMLAADQHTC